jgi:anthranilate phosphoribosyltransferase
VGRAALRPLLAEALRRLGTRRAMVVHGAEGLDEVSLAGPTHVSAATTDALREFIWTPDDFGLPPCPTAALVVAGPEESAAMISSVLAGEPGPARDIVVANAGAALWVAGRHATLGECVQSAAAAIDRGTAHQLLERLITRSRGA